MSPCEPRIKCNRETNGATLVEFAVSLFVFVLLFLLPMLNVISYLIGTSLGIYLCSQAASAAAHSTRFSDALLAVSRCEQQTEGGFLGSLIKLKPMAEKKQACDLYVTVTDVAAKSEKRFGPNIPYKAATAPSTKIYEYTISANFNVGPLFNLKAIPLVSEIPVAVKEAAFSCSSSVQCENPDGLSN
jgi:hypothetical protein